MDALTLSLWSVIPFAGMLLSIAIMPLVIPAWYEKHQLLVAVGWALLFCIPFASSSSATSIRPKYAIRHTEPSDRMTQMMATVALFFTIDAFSIDMKRTMMCGMPK